LSVRERECVMTQSNMNLEYVNMLCKDLGIIQKFDVNENIFGNIELEIITPKGNEINILSDRGEFSYYLKKNSPFRPLTSINKMVGEEKVSSFRSLEEVVDYLKSNIETIENKCS